MAGTEPFLYQTGLTFLKGFLISTMKSVFLMSTWLSHMQEEIFYTMFSFLTVIVRNANSKSGLIYLAICVSILITTIADFDV